MSVDIVACDRNLPFRNMLTFATVCGGNSLLPPGLGERQGYLVLGCDALGLPKAKSASHLWRLVLVLFATLCLSACNPAPTPEPTRISFVAQSAVNLEEYVAQFEAAHPGIKVHVSYWRRIPDDWPRHFDAALLLNVPSMLTGRADLLLDLMPLIEADSQFGVGDYYPGALTAGDLNGRRVTIPIGLKFNALVYDPRQLSAAGAALPTPGWTWEESMNTARVVGRYQAGVGSKAVFVKDRERIRMLVNWLQQHTPLYEEIDGRFMPLLDGPELQSTVSSARGAVAEVTAATEPGVYPSQPLVYLQAGEATMTEHSLFFFIRQRSQYPELAVAALPQPNVYRDMRASGGLAISRGTAHAQAVWQWIRFLSQQSGPGASFGGYDLPARRSVAKELQVWEAMDPETAQVIQTILAAQDSSGGEQNHEPLLFIRGDLAIALQQVYNEGADPGTALTTAQREAMASVSAWYDGQDAQVESFSVIPPPVANEAQGSEVLSVLVQSPEQEAYLALVKEFEASHPGWSIQTAPSSERTGVDCLLFQTNSYYASTPFKMQSILPIGSVSELNSHLTNDSFFPQAIEAVSWHGQLLGVPTAIRPLVLYYDADVFAELGLDSPTSDWTVANVLDAAEAIAAANPTLLGYAPRHGIEVRFVLEQQGIPLFTDEAYPQPRFTAPDVVRAIERLRALQDGRQVVSSSSMVMELPISSAGKPLGYDVSSVDVVALQPYPETRWPAEVNVSAVPRQSTHVQMAWEWIAFLAVQEGLHRTALPAVRLAAESELARQTLGADLYTAYLTALERAAPLPERDATVIEDVALWWFNQAMQDVNDGDLEPALEQAQAQAEQFVNCVTTTGRVDDVETLATCARQVDPEHWLGRMTAPGSSSER